jgi:hypothetical protein
VLDHEGPTSATLGGSGARVKKQTAPGVGFSLINKKALDCLSQLSSKTGWSRGPVT